MSATPETAIKPLRADAQRNRDAILKAAREIVAQDGVEAQVDDVARRAGVGVGTVYRHFANKDVLMGELMLECMQENADLARDQAAVSDPWDAFAGTVRGGCETMAIDAAKRRMWAIASNEAFEYARDAKQSMHDATAVLIDRAHAAGVLRTDFTIDDMGTLMCGLGAAIEMSIAGAGDWRRLVEFSLDGLRPR